MTVPFSFSSQVGPIPLSELDSNFSYFEESVSQLTSAIQTSDSIFGNHIGVGAPPVSNNKALFVEKDSLEGTNVIGSAFQFQRYFDTTATWSGNRNGMRMLSTVGDPSGGGAPISLGIVWSLSAECFIEPGASVTGGATSIVGTTQNNSLTSSSFAGSLQVKTLLIYGAPTSVTPAVGLEINEVNIGLDHPTANNGIGNRCLLNLISKTDTTLSGSPGYAIAEIGSAIYVRNGTTGETGTTVGYFRYGMVVDDLINSGGSNPLSKDAIFLQTFGRSGLHITGGNTTAQIFLEDSSNAATAGYANCGIVVNSQNYTSGTAIRVHEDMYIALNSSNTVRMKYNSTSQNIEFYNGGTLVGHLVVAGGADHAI